MARKIALALALFLLPLSIQVFALGLGNISSTSALNQPLVAEIQLISPEGVPQDEMRVRLASAEDFARAGIDRPFFLSELSFSVERKRSGTLYVKVASKNPIREPFLDFLVELNWPSGRVVREYTLLLDPPTFTRERAPVVQAPAPAQTAVTAPAPTTRSTQAAPAPVARGYSGDTYGPVGRGETLWTIAMRTRPDASVSPQQMMIALQRKNPQAFVKDNINNLMAGAVLTVPSAEEIAQISGREAVQESRRQMDEWRGSRAEPAPAPAVVPAEPATEAPAAETPEAPAEPAAPATEETPAPAPAAEEPKAELKILAPTEETASAEQPGDTAAAPTEETPAAPAGEAVPVEGSAISQELALTAENVDALQRENEELRGRFGDLETQVDSMQKLLNLRESELAKLQAQMAQAEAERQKPLARLLSEPANVLILVLVVVVLTAIVWVAARRRSPAAKAAEAPIPATFAAPAVIPEPQPIPPMGEETVVQAAPAKPAPKEEPPADPLAEADVYMAYGRFSQAEEMLRDSLAVQPGNAALRLKLLEVYHATGDRDAFQQEAAELYEQVSEDDPQWLKAASMGRELCPEVPMFGGGPAVAPEEAPSFIPEPTQDELDAMSVVPENGDWFTSDRSPEAAPKHRAFEEPALDEHPEHGAAADQGIDFDLDFLKETPPGMEPARSAADDMASIDFDLDTLEREAKEALGGAGEEGAEAKYDLTGAEAETERLEDLAWEEPPHIELAPETTREVMSADLSGGDLNFEPAAGSAPEEPKEIDELDLLPDLDEVSTKLDLARAYQDMGDTAGAREILEEVLREGNEVQQQEARTLLDQLPG